MTSPRSINRPTPFAYFWTRIHILLKRNTNQSHWLIISKENHKGRLFYPEFRPLEKTNWGEDEFAAVFARVGNKMQGTFSPWPTHITSTLMKSAEYGQWPRCLQNTVIAHWATGYCDKLLDTSWQSLIQNGNFVLKIYQLACTQQNSSADLSSDINSN